MRLENIPVGRCCPHRARKSWLMALMETYLQFIRGLLPFGSGGISTPGNNELRDWLDGLDRKPAADAAHQLASGLPRLLAERTNLTVRMRILDDVYAVARAMLPELEASTDRAPLPLRNDGQVAALAADNLLKALAAGYIGVLKGLATPHMSAKRLELLGSAIERATDCLTERQVLAYRVYAPPSASAWGQLHRLYRLAWQRGLTDDQLAQVERRYLASLLLAFAEPGKFARGELPELRRSVARLASHARLHPARGSGLPGEGALFVVRSRDGQAGHRLARASGEPLGSADWIVDCTAAVETLRREIVEMDVNLPSAENANRLTVLKKLMIMWEGQPTRRFNRMRFMPRGDLLIGLPDILRALADDELLRQRGSWQGDGQHHGLDISEWVIVDQSPDGFGIRYAAGEVSRLEVGELVGLRPRERDQMHVCLVRRISNAGAARFELGLQELSPSMIRGELLQRGAPPAGALYFPALPGFNGVPGLLAPPELIREGQQLTLRSEAGQQPIRVIRTLERHPRCGLFLVQLAG